jgi:hypothetical protein
VYACIRCDQNVHWFGTLAAQNVNKEKSITTTQCDKGEDHDHHTTASSNHPTKPGKIVVLFHILAATAERNSLHRFASLARIIISFWISFRIFKRKEKEKVRKA